MVNQIASGTGSQEQGKKSGDEGLQKLGQEARSQAPSLSPSGVWGIWPSEHTINSQPSERVVSYSDVMYVAEIFEKHLELTLGGYRLPEVSGFRMARKV